jgi:hemerythrin HHE cation binding domain-containing protein
MTVSLMNTLEHDHESLGALLDNCESALTTNDPAEAFTTLDLFWARLAMHIRAEHLCLFPALLDVSGDQFISGGAVSRKECHGTIAALRDDHNFFMGSLAQAMKLLRGALANPAATDDELFKSVRTLIAAVRTRLETHNQIEEEQVYRWPFQLLDNSELARLNQCIKQELESLPNRFRESGG